MMKLLLMFGIILLLITSAFSQSRTITGRVTSDDDPDGLPGVNVVIKGINTGVFTDLRGNYSIQIPDGNVVLIYSFVGYVSQEQAVGNRNIINVTLRSDLKSLDEVIVVAYGTADKGNFTGSAVSIRSELIETRPITNVSNAIEGNVVGVITTSASGQPGSTPAIRIRGFGSVNASNAPLYVVDGVPFTADISNINPDDIEDITILKDAASAAMYGSRAANGVIMITTKRGKKDKPTVNVKVM